MHPIKPLRNFAAFAALDSSDEMPDELVCNGGVFGIATFAIVTFDIAAFAIERQQRFDLRDFFARFLQIVLGKIALTVLRQGDDFFGGVLFADGN